MSEPEIKTYSLREEFAGALIHGAGILLLLLFFPLLLSRAGKWQGPLCFAGAVYYCISLLFMFTASTVYHLLREKKKKIQARKADHCAIYFLISGTYAPVMLGAVQSVTGYWICGILFFLALAGSAGKIWFDQKFHRWELFLYLLMGWCCLIVGGPLVHSLSPAGLILLAAGGIAYSAGVIFYVQKREFSHALWHLFVLAGAILHFFAILTIQGGGR